jgi:hypothetical protein
MTDIGRKPIIGKSRHRRPYRLQLVVVSAGAADANTAACAAITVQDALRRNYDLMTDWSAG